MVGRTDEIEEEIYFYLSRASFIRPFRSPCLADVGGEYLRLLALQTASTDDEDGNQILEYISNPPARSGNQAAEPRDHFGEETLVAAQFAAERKLLEHYARALTIRGMRIFSAS